jgi:uncharacterized protein (TIGR03435 family)
MRKWAALLALAILAPAFGQTPAFEVADVRMYQPDTEVVRGADGSSFVRDAREGILGIIVMNGVLTNYSQVAGKRMQAGEPVFAANGKVAFRSVTMRELIMQSYKEILRPEYLTGGPSWLDTAHFELIAKAPPGTPVDTERLMLQGVLAERFHLVIHHEQKPMPVYALVLGKKELKLQAAAGPGDPDCKRVFGVAGKDGKVQPDGRSHAVCANVKMADLAYWLPRLEPFEVDKPAIDLTGISGTYDLHLDWASAGGTDVAAGATMLDMLDKLGLKLEARKDPMPVIVIDHVEQPDAN